MSPSRWRRASLGLLLATCVGCASTPAVAPRPSLPPLASVAEADAALTALRAQEPESFKMVHQVVARYEGKSYVMTGYMLGRKEGSFRVSAAAGMGPRLFDVARVGGQWEAQVHLRQLAEKLDPKHMGRSVERIYFTDASGPLELREGHWVSRAELAGEEDADAVEVWRDGNSLAVARKRFFLKGSPVLDIDYLQPEPVGGHWLARKVRLKDARGYELELSVTDYVPGFPVPDERLRVQPR